MKKIILTALILILLLASWSFGSDKHPYGVFIGMGKNKILRSKKGWQRFIVRKGKGIKNKGLDGFFIDNADVYHHYKKPKIYKGLTTSGLLKS